MTFEEIIAAHRANTETPLSENVATEILSAHQSEIGIREAAITERENTITARDATIVEKDQEAIRLKAANWDILQSAPARKADDDTDNDSGKETPKRGISAMFEK